MLNTTTIFKLFSLSFKLGNKPVFYFLTLFFTLSLHAQENLVPNGSFEEYNWCPDYVNGYFISACKYWNMPTLGSSDYFNACSTDMGSDTFTQFSVPQNYIGYQYAHTGNAYAGLVFVQVSDITPTNSEYIQIKLSKQLEYEKFYHLRFYVNNSCLCINQQPTCPNSIGALFTENVIGGNNYDIISQTPQFQSDLNLFFCDTLEWYELNYTFQASGNENYLTIGVFTAIPTIKMTDYSGQIINGQGIEVYYYIDDVSLTEVDYLSLIEGKIPNVITPNGDGVNDFFYFDNGIVHAKKLTIFNRWGNVVYSSSDNFKWDGKYQNKESDDGVYYYKIEVTDKITLNGFIQLMR